MYRLLPEHQQDPHESLIKQFIAFVQAQTWPESRSMLKEHPELLNQHALELVLSWASSIEDYDTSWWYHYHYALLQACLLMGVDALFESFAPNTRPDGGVTVPREFEDDFRQLTELDNAANSNPAIHHDRITLMENMLRRLDGTMYPSFRTAMLINLGQAYVQLPAGNQAFNLAKAAARFTEAAHFFTPKTAPPEYSESQNALGIAYSELTAGDPAANLEKAIACYHEALRFRSPDYARADYAATKNNLGIAYAMLPGGGHAANLKRAIACFTDALRVLTPKEAADYADVQRNLAAATAELDRIVR